MNRYIDSTLDYRCVDGCGMSIYNTTKDYNMVCPECGGRLVKVNKKVGDLLRGREESK